MKKIAFFTQNLDTGGIQKVVSNLANNLIDDYQLTIVLAEDDKPIVHDLHTDIKIQAIETIKVDVYANGVGVLLMKYRVKELDKILSKIQPDLLFSFGEYSNIIALKASYQCKKIISLRAVFQSMKSKKIHLLSFAEYEGLMIKYYPLADKIITVSNYIAKEVVNLVPSLKSKVVTIHNGIDMTYIQSIPDETVPYKKYILNIGRLHSQKGQLDLIKAFSKISDKIDYDLIIIGEGPERKDIESKIKALGLESRIKLLGTIQVPYSYLEHTELFVFPSYYEGFPNVVLEAMACFCPILAYKFEGYDEILEDYNNLCIIGDVDCLSEKMLSLLRNRELREELSIKMHKDSQKFKLKNSVANYYKEIFATLAQ